MIYETVKLPLSRPRARTSPVAATRITLITVACISVLLQTVIGFTQANITAAVIAGASAILTATYLFRRGVMDRTPISGLIVFGLNFTLLLGPLAFQTLDWRPIAFNLDAPIEATTTAAFASVVACLSHAVYRAFPPFTSASRWVACTVHKPLFIFQPPTNVQLWMMGFIGLAAVWSSNTSAAAAGIEYGDVGGKFLQAFTPFVAAPALIPSASCLFRSQRPTRVPWLCLVAYFGLVLLLAFARNSRGTFATVILIVLLSIALAVWIGRLKLSRRVALGGLAAFVVGFPLMGALSDLSTAMLITRAARTEVTAGQLIEQTLQTAADKDALSGYRARAAILDNRYNEIYISNDFFQRLTLLKFLDLNLYHTRGITEPERSYARHIFGQRLVALIPTPIIKQMGLDVDKTALQFSGGDVYLFLASRGSLGGFVTGSAVADGLAIMGLLFWPVLMAIALVTFILNDAFGRYGGWGIALSPAILFNLDRLFMFGLNGDNLASGIGGILRGYPQSLLLYAGLFLITAILSEGIARGIGVNLRRPAAKQPRRAG